MRLDTINSTNLKKITGDLTTANLKLSLSEAQVKSLSEKSLGARIIP